MRQLTREVSRREVEVLKKVIRVISHELNNSLAPIASLVNSARIIAKNPEHAEKLDPRLRHDRGACSAPQRVPRRLRQVRALAETARGVGRLDALRCRFAELYPHAKISSPGAGAGFFDPVQVEQLLINLLKNASESGGPASAIELAIDSRRGRLADGTGHRSGKGLQRGSARKRFLPFYSTKDRGSGMGLALSREVAEAHGGRLSSQSRRRRQRGHALAPGAGTSRKTWRAREPDSRSRMRELARGNRGSLGRACGRYEPRRYQLPQCPASRSRARPSTRPTPAPSFSAGSRCSPRSSAGDPRASPARS